MNDGGKKFGEIRTAMDTVGDNENRILFDMGAYELVKKAKENQIQKGEKMSVQLQVRLEQLYNGDNLTPTLKRVKICPGCTLKSKSDYCKNTCKATCHPTFETKIFMQGHMQFHNQVEVPSNKRCRDDRAPFPVVIEKGMKDGDTITFKAEGEQKENQIPGDVEFTLKGVKHSRFERRGDNLYMDMTLSLKESLLGFEKTIQHLDGRTVTVRTSDVTGPGYRYQIKGEGMWNREQARYGDMVVTMAIDYPKKKLSAKLRETVEAEL